MACRLGSEIRRVRREVCRMRNGSCKTAKGSCTTGTSGCRAPAGVGQVRMELCRSPTPLCRRTNRGFKDAQQTHDNGRGTNSRKMKEPFSSYNVFYFRGEIYLNPVVISRISWLRSGTCHGEPRERFSKARQTLLPADIGRLGHTPDTQRGRGKRAVSFFTRVRIEWSASTLPMACRPS